MCFKVFENSPSKIATQANKSLTIHDWTISFFKSIDAVDTLATSLLTPDIYGKYDFLKILETNPPLGFQFCYITFHKNEQLIGWMPCEIKHFNAQESLNFSKESNPFLLKVRKALAKKVSFETLIVGSLLLTGEHSYYFDNQLIINKDKYFLISKGIELAKKTLSEENITVRNVFIKDFFEPQEPFVTEGYNEFQVEPNFIFSIPNEWHTFDNYLDALSSKYRVRTKRAFKKAEGVEKKEFNLERILAHQSDINVLYQNISQKSAFNLVDLHEDYFVDLKRQMGEKFRLWGYFTEGVLVGFFTTIDNGEELEAHYLGYNEAVNFSHHIYHNFLLDIIKVGIETKKKRIIFARTANEIKSSVGAVAHNMFLYMKHENPVINRLLPYFLKILSPREVWQPRNPFKD
jgi:predicted N-acyltransferase